MKLELEMQELKQVWYGLDGSAQTSFQIRFI